jgi:2-oxoisovalerate dehydrogenase E2 component (dihydrolipoyl transacylase)
VPAAAGEERALTPMRRAIAEHMSRARADIPDAWTLTEIDVTRLVRYRESLQADWQARHGFELTYLPFFIKAVLAGLRAVPELNATWQGDHVTIHRQYHLGIAVSIDAGLVVPVLRDADQLSVAGIAGSLRTLVQRARGGRLTLDDLQGATFTVNNPGALGSIMSQPIVPLGQSGIVTMEAIVKRPVVTADDAIAVRSMMNSCLSFDHRVLDGAGALRCLKELKHQLEQIEYPLY